MMTIKADAAKEMDETFEIIDIGVNIGRLVRLIGPPISTDECMEILLRAESLADKIRQIVWNRLERCAR